MPGVEAMVEQEMLFNGGDERAADALVRENTDQGMSEITARMEAATTEQHKAALPQEYACPFSGTLIMRVIAMQTVSSPGARQVLGGLAGVHE
jgi:hypothetical protein